MNWKKWGWRLTKIVLFVAWTASAIFVGLLVGVADTGDFDIDGERNGEYMAMLEYDIAGEQMVEFYTGNNEDYLICFKEYYSEAPTDNVTVMSCTEHEITTDQEKVRFATLAHDAGMNKSRAIQLSDALSLNAVDSQKKGDER